jgi:threonine dehydratase
MAVRIPVPAALDIIWRGAHDVVEVTEAEVEAAIRAYFDDTHQLAEGAGAAPLAALLKTPARAGRTMGVILCGGNIDRDLYLRIM